MIEKNDKLQDINQSIDESAMNYYTDSYQLGDTKEQIQIGGEVEAIETKIVEVDTSDTGIEKVNQTYTLTFASSPDGKLWSIGINGMEKTFKVGFFNNDTLAMTTIASEMQTWLGEDYTVAHTTGFVISISKYDGSAITKTSPNLVRKINLSGFDSISVITVTVDGVAVVLDGPTHSGDTSTAITYLKSQLSSSIYYMDDDGVDLIISRKDGAIPVLSYSSPNKYTYEVQYYYGDTPSAGMYPEYTTLTVDGTPYVYKYEDVSRAYFGDKQVRDFYGWTEEEVGFTISSTTSTTNELGYKFLTKNPCVLTSVKKNASSGATRALLKDSGGTTLATASFSGNVATFNYTLSDATTYQISADNNGATYTATTRNTGAVTFPEVGHFINYTDAYNGASTFGNIESMNITYAGVNIANKTQLYNKSSGGPDSTWLDSALYFNQTHTLGLWNTDYSAITISSINHYTNPASFPDDTAKTTITTTNHTTTASISTYTEIVITRTATGNNYFIPVGFNPSRIEITAESSAGRSTGTWEGGAKRGLQSCNSSVSGFVADRVFQTSGANYGAIVKVTRAGFYISRTTAVANKLYIKCTK